MQVPEGTGRTLHLGRDPRLFDGDRFASSDKILDECDVFATPGGIFGSEGNHFIRISLCMPEERLAEAAQRVKTRLKR